MRHTHPSLPPPHPDTMQDSFCIPLVGIPPEKPMKGLDWECQGWLWGSYGYVEAERSLRRRYFSLSFNAQRRNRSENNTISLLPDSTWLYLTLPNDVWIRMMAEAAMKIKYSTENISFSSRTEWMEMKGKEWKGKEKYFIWWWKNS